MLGLNWFNLLVVAKPLIKLSSLSPVWSPPLSLPVGVRLMQQQRETFKEKRNKNERNNIYFIYVQQKKKNSHANK